MNAHCRNPYCRDAHFLIQVIVNFILCRIPLNITKAFDGSVCLFFEEDEYKTY